MLWWISCPIQNSRLKSGAFEEALKKRIRRVTAGDFTGSDLTRAMDMPTSASNENKCWEVRWEVCLGHEGASDLALYEVISPKFHDTSLLERFAESESGEIDNTVGRLTRQCDESLRNVRSSVLPSSTLGREMEQYKAQAEKRRGMLASGQGTMGGLEAGLLPWYNLDDKSLQIELYILSNDGYFESAGVPTAIDLRSTVISDFESFRRS